MNSSELEAKMRHAYTKACVAWPRMSLRPISLVLAEAFLGVSGEAVENSMNRLVLRAGTELKNERAVKNYIGTLPVADKRPLLSFLLGLDESSMRRVYQESMTGNYVKARSSRNLLLRTRRNLLAIALIHTAMEEAEKLRCQT